MRNPAVQNGGQYVTSVSYETFVVAKTVASLPGTSGSGHFRCDVTSGRNAFWGAPHLLLIVLVKILIELSPYTTRGYHRVRQLTGRQDIAVHF